jgi:3-dehydroquinate dehydratase-1
MRLQSKKQVTVRGRVIGGPDVLVCLPLVAKDTTELLAQADELLPLDPDLLEWRIDGYDNVENLSDSLQALNTLRSKIGDIPLIYTCRIDAEGGFKKIDRNKRLELIQASIRSKDLDIVDVELCNDSAFINEVKQAAGESGAGLILSYHNFNETPDADAIFAKLAQAQKMGADIAKVAVMPRGYGDVLTLLSATLKARDALDVPLVTMAMGGEGGVTRLAGGLFGADITFAIGKTASAPGQIPIGQLRQAMAVLYGDR